MTDPTAKIDPESVVVAIGILGITVLMMLDQPGPGWMWKGRGHLLGPMFILMLVILSVGIGNTLGRKLDRWLHDD